jgi:uncharacterized protein YfkK (UPF0435 family)
MRKVVKPEDLEIPVECFLYPTGEQQIQSEGGEHYQITQIDFRNEFKTYVHGAEFPYEGFVTNEILWVTNQAKSVFIEAIKLLVKPQFIIGTVISLMFFREQLIDSFNRLGHRVFSTAMLKDRHISIFAKELQYIIFEFMRHLVPEEKADKFSMIFSRIIDNDDAYKQRLKDIFSMTNKKKLKSPKELTRLVNLLCERQNYDIWTKKVKSAVLLLRLLIAIVPSAKKGYLSAINACNLDNLILHWEDIYWSVYKKDYNFAGMTHEERLKLVKEKGWQLPNNLI